MGWCMVRDSERVNSTTSSRGCVGAWITCLCFGVGLCMVHVVKVWLCGPVMLLRDVATLDIWYPFCTIYSKCAHLEGVAVQL